MARMATMAAPDFTVVRGAGTADGTADGIAAGIAGNVRRIAGPFGARNLASELRFSFTRSPLLIARQ